MKKMIKNQKILDKKLHTQRYFNGQLGVYIHDYSGEPVAELSIMDDTADINPEEFILKDYSENEEIAQEVIDSQLIIPTNRFILIGSHLCPICQIET